MFDLGGGSGGGWFLFLTGIGDNGLGGPCLSPVCDGSGKWISLDSHALLTQHLSDSNGS